MNKLFTFHENLPPVALTTPLTNPHLHLHDVLGCHQSTKFLVRHMRKQSVQQSLGARSGL